LYSVLLRDLCGYLEMEVDFDKEMDALLRQSVTRGVLVGDKPKVHLDADAIAAFAENAVPEKSRVIYTQHLAFLHIIRKIILRVGSYTNYLILKLH